MGTRSQDNNTDQPPVPGGDPDQPPNDLPIPPSRDDTRDTQNKNKGGYGHIGNKEVPAPKGAPPPHEIF